MATASAVALHNRPRTQLDIFMGKVITVEDRDEIRRALPRHVPYDRFERNLTNALMNEPRLMQCDPRQVCREVMKIAALGLLIDAQLGEAYLIASRTGPQARIGYRGLIKLARQSGQVAKIYAHEVRANDKVAGKLGTNKWLDHEPDFFGDRGDMVGVYAVIVFKDGETDFEAMSLADVNKIRDRSDGWKAFKAGAIKDTPWNSSYEEMSKKTALRRLIKRSPQSPDLVQAFQVEDDADHPELATSAPRQLTVRNPLADEEDTGPSIEQQIDQREEVDTETGEVTQVDRQSVDHAPAEQPKPAEQQSEAGPKPQDEPKRGRGRPPSSKTAPAQEKPAEPQPAKTDSAPAEVDPLVAFTQGCSAAETRAQLEALRDRHKPWFARVSGTEDFKVAERAYGAAVDRLDDEERAQSEREANGDADTGAAGPSQSEADVGAGADAQGVAAEGIAAGGQDASPNAGERAGLQIASGGDRAPPATWEDLIPDGEWSPRQHKKLGNVARGLFNAGNLVEVREVEDSFREVIKIDNPDVQAAFKGMIDARKAVIKANFQPGD